MALAFADDAAQIITNEEPANGAAIVSSEIDLGANTLCGRLCLFISIADWAGAPTGTVKAELLRERASGGDLFTAETWVWAPTADTAYLWEAHVTDPPRYCKLRITNSSGQNVAADSLNVWYQAVKVTA